jgi:hypothetical protein
MKQIKLISKLGLALIAITAISVAMMTTQASYNMQTADAQRLPNNSVRSETIVNGQVTTDDLATGAVTSAKIADGEVEAQDIGTDQVTAEELAGVSKLIFATCTIHTGSIPPHSAREDRTNCAVSGATSSDKVIASPEHVPGHNVFYNGAVMFTDGIVQISLENVGDEAVDPGDVTFNLIVFKD